MVVPGEIGVSWLQADMEFFGRIPAADAPSEPPEVKRKYYKQDVQYRLCSFWLDRDDKVGPLGLEKCGSKVAPSLAKVTSQRDLNW